MIDFSTAYWRGLHKWVQAQGTSTGAGSTLCTLTPPAGYKYIIVAGSFSHNDTAARDVAIKWGDAGGNNTIAALTAVAQTIYTQLYTSIGTPPMPLVLDERSSLILETTGLVNAKIMTLNVVVVVLRGEDLVVS